MDFQIQFLSFYLIEVDDQTDSAKKHQHFQTLTTKQYEDSVLQTFLDGELAKIAKRKVERHPKSDTAPTRIGQFIVEPGHELSTNPNYNLFNEAILAEDEIAFQQASEKFVEMYVDTSAIRGGAFLILSARIHKYFDDPFIFILKCDFEPNIATISNESTLIKQVEMAITTRNMKSIQYPYMLEAGIVEHGEIKIHQASHARYFQDFLPFVEYEQSLPTIMKTEVKTMVEEHFQEVHEFDEEQMEELEEAMEVWEASPEREIQERLSHHDVVEASAQIVEHIPEAELRMKADEVTIRGLLADFGENIHLAKSNGRYVVMIEADEVSFDKDVSPIEFLKPEDIQQVINKITR